jgi:hypothetical protein
MRNFYYWIKFSISSALLRPNTRILRYGVPHADGYVNMFPLTNRERQKRKHDNSIGQRDSNFMYNATPRHGSSFITRFGCLYKFSLTYKIIHVYASMPSMCYSCYDYVSHPHLTSILSCYRSNYHTQALG